MFYTRLSNDELKSLRYSNLMAELIESGYSICTLGDHMGVGQHCQEDDPVIWGKLRGEIEIFACEAIGLTGLFDCTYEYLFSGELLTVNGKPQAYYKWHEFNQRLEYEMAASKLGFKIYDALQEKPYLFELMETAVGLKETESKAATEILRNLRQDIKRC